MAVFLLHINPTGDEWLTSWHVDPLPAFAFALTIIGYWLAFHAVQQSRRPFPIWYAVAFFSGIAALITAIMGPPVHFGGSSFAAHMVQHLLIVQVAAPLLILGRPVHVILRGLPPEARRILVRATVGRRGVRHVLGLITHPFTATVLFNGNLLFWHQPTYYDAAVLSPLLHELEHMTFLVTALIFWWMLVDPLPRSSRPSATAALLALFATWMAGDLLGAMLTLAQEPLYPHYAAAAQPWGVNPVEDQRIGGLIMWVSGGVFYAAVMIGILAAPFVRGQTRGVRASTVALTANAGRSD